MKCTKCLKNELPKENKILKFMLCNKCFNEMENKGFKMNKTKVFNLNNEQAFKRSEKFKSELENKGFKVSCLNNGFNSVIVKGVKNE